jgi:hypothetical protein
LKRGKIIIPTNQLQYPSENNCFENKHDAENWLSSYFLTHPSFQGGPKKAFILKIDQARHMVIEMANAKQLPVKIDSYFEYTFDRNLRALKLNSPMMQEHAALPEIKKGNPHNIY